MSTKAPQLANSQSELARACGVSQPAVFKWVNHPLWSYGRKPPWDVDKAKQWRLAVLEHQIESVEQRIGKLSDSADGNGCEPETQSADSVRQISAERSERLKLMIARRQKLEIERDKLADKYVLIEDQARVDVAKALALKAQLLNLKLVLAPKLTAVTDQHKAEEIIEAECIRILEHFASGGQ